jgi:hypothetical protein
MFELSDDELKSLLEYFVKRAGYISYEFDHEIWKLIKRMQLHVGENELDKRSIKIP